MLEIIDEVVLDGNAVYEIDRQCLQQKNRMENSTTNRLESVSVNDNFLHQGLIGLFLLVWIKKFGA